MTPDQHLMKYTSRCDHCRLENWFCYDCAKSAIAAAVDERDLEYTEAFMGARGTGPMAPELARLTLKEIVSFAVAEERTKWMLATAHDHTCDFVRTPSPLCNCGANARLAELQVEGAAAIRARGSNATSD